MKKCLYPEIFNNNRFKCVYYEKRTLRWRDVFGLGDGVVNGLIDWWFNDLKVGVTKDWCWQRSVEQCVIECKLLKMEKPKRKFNTLRVIRVLEDENFNKLL